MPDRSYEPMLCYACGAPLPASLECRYCQTRHERTERYRGPDIQDENWNIWAHGDLSVSSMQSMITGTVSYSTSTAHMRIGGPVPAGSVYLVGEPGPEYFVPLGIGVVHG